MHPRFENPIELFALRRNGEKSSAGAYKQIAEKSQRCTHRTQ